MIKYIAMLKDLRVGHDKLGRLKRASTPLGVQNYLTVTWDELVPFPTSKSCRLFSLTTLLTFGSLVPEVQR